MLRMELPGKRKRGWTKQEEGQFTTRALLRLERTMNLLEGGKGRGREDGGRVGRGRGGEREEGEGREG